VEAPKITYVEWMSQGVMVHFADGVSAFYDASLLFHQRSTLPPVTVKTSPSKEKQS
jgi:hypothetical protein